jgi:hypothetical protein
LGGGQWPALRRLGAPPPTRRIPLYEILEQGGLQVLLVNARDVHNVRGRKSDVTDCEWLRDLHSVGLLRASFRPAAAIVPLRSFRRQRETLVEEASTRIQGMQKALTEMNLKLHTVLADLTGQTELRIVRGILDGERDPERLALHRDPRCHASQAEIVAALTGNYRAEHLFAPRQNFAAYEFLLKQIAECDTEIEGILTTLAARQHPPFSATAGSPSLAGFQASAPIRYPRPAASAHRWRRLKPNRFHWCAGRAAPDRRNRYRHDPLANRKAFHLVARAGA